ncbi:sigma-70 family RNA polymerase sigma factor [Pedobacter sp. UYEF25]
MNDSTNSENKDEIELWVKLYTTSLYKWALLKTSDKESAEDLVQDTFLSAHQQHREFKGKSSAKTWLFSILNHKISSYYRKKYKGISIKTEEEHIFVSLFDEHGHWKHQEKPMTWNSDEKQLLDDPEFNRTLMSCFEKLPDHWQLAVNFKYIEQKKGKIICQELDISPTNFWQILHRAKLQLRKCLELNWFKA